MDSPLPIASSSAITAGRAITLRPPEVEAEATFTDAALVAIFNVPGQRVILGYADVREEVREHRTAYALRHALDWLCTKGVQGRFRQELLAMATVLAKLVMARRPPGVEEVAQWTICRGGMSFVSSTGDWSLETARCVEGLLRDGVVDRRLVLDPEMATLWTRCGAIIANLWHWQPLGEYAEAMDNDQVVPDVDLGASLARQVIQSIVACSTHEELKACLAGLLSQSVFGGMPEIADTLRLAERLVDDGWAFAER